MEEIIKNLEMRVAQDVTDQHYHGEDKMLHLRDPSEDTNLLIRVFPDNETGIYDGRSTKHIYYPKRPSTQGILTL
jgi:hypothetical protein